MKKIRKIDKDKVHKLLASGDVPAAFLECHLYVVGCLIKQGWVKTMPHMDLDEMISEAFIVFAHTASKFNLDKKCSFLSFYYTQLKYHMIDVWLNSGLIHMSKSYRVTNTIKFFDIISAETPKHDTEPESRETVMDVIADDVDFVERLMVHDTLHKMLDTLDDSQRDILFNPKELPPECFLSETIDTTRKVIKARHSALTRLKKVAPQYA